MGYDVVREEERESDTGFIVVRPIVLTFISCFLTIIGSLYNKERGSLYRLHEKKRERGVQK